MAGVATKMAAEALGLPTGATETDVGIAIAGGDTQALIRLKEIDKQFEKDMKALDVDILRINAESQGSARQMAIAKGTEPQAILSAVFIVGFFLVFGIFIQAVFDGIEMPAEFLALISALIGIMAASVQQIMNFWFGSNSSSRHKTDLLSKAQPIA